MALQRVKWKPDNFEVIGYLGDMLYEDDPRTAQEQLDANYPYGGGFVVFDGFTFNPETKAISYPGDPDFYPVAEAKLRDETIYLYPSAWVLILQPDGSYKIARMD